MKRWKKIVGAGAASLILAALPFTLQASKSGLDLEVNEACADGGGCCIAYGQICGGRMHWGLCSPGGGGGA